MRMSTNCGASHIATHPSPPGPPSLAIALITKLYVLIISFHQRKKGFSGSCSSHIFIFRRAGAGGGRTRKTMKNISLFNKARRNRSCTLSEPSWASERQTAECLSIDKSSQINWVIPCLLLRFSEASPTAARQHQEETCSGCDTCPKSSGTKETAREIDWLDGARRRFREIGPGKAQMIINFTIGGNKG